MPNEFKYEQLAKDHLISKKNLPCEGQRQINRIKASRRKQTMYGDKKINHHYAYQNKNKMFPISILKWDLAKNIRML